MIFELNDGNHTFQVIEGTVNVNSIGSTLVFTQAIAATNWIFNHTLNRVPTIEVTDLVGNRIFVDTQATLTQAIVRSESPITGVVYLN
jgi:hypothetical protein